MKDKNQIEFKLYSLLIVLMKMANRIDRVENGKEAIAFMKKTPGVHLILMDIKMPAMNVYEATKEIRAFDKNVIIFAQTAFALSGDREKSIEAGCNDYITKPIKKDKLFEKINHFFNQ